MESGIREDFAHGIQNMAQGIRNPITFGIQNPSSTDKYWNPESTACNPESRTVLGSPPWGELMLYYLKHLVFVGGRFEDLVYSIQSEEKKKPFCKCS